jgi:hypothetical protein
MGSLKIGFAYIYLDSNDQIQQSTKNIIGTIIKQLLWPLPRIPKGIEETWAKYQHEGPPTEQTIEMLCEACKAFTETYICVDALDECSHVKSLLGQFARAHLKVTSIRLICTARPHIRSMLNGCGLNPYTISIEARESDVRAFAEWRIENDRKDRPGIMDDKLKEEIIRKLLDVFDGVSVNVSCAECVLHVDFVADFFYLYFISTLSSMKKRKPPDEIN